MLFTTLAASFGMPARGVVVPTHAFVELGPPGGKILEVETTSDTGFDLVHDERFYREAAATWSSSRGLAPVTLAQYRERRILAPYQLMAHGMRNQSSYAEGKERDRLVEIAAFTDAESVELQRDRLQVYVNEAITLHEKEAARTTVKLFDCVQPAIQAIASKWATDSKTSELAAWAGWYYADALEVVRRSDEAIKIADSALDHVDAKWKDAAALRQNYLSILTDRMVELMQAKDYARATTVHGKHIDVCRSDAICADNLKVVYLNWSIEQQNAGDWQGARKALGDCVTQLPGNRECDAALKDLESRHRF
jgi:tetratricopeptide (TPR) repeat protein